MQNSSVERHDALTDTLLDQSAGLDRTGNRLRLHNLHCLTHARTVKMAGGRKSDKNSAAPGPDTSGAQKKSPKSGANGVSGPGAQQAPPSGSCLGPLLSTVFYAALIGAAGFAAFYVQQAVDEIRQIGAKHEEGARRGAELGAKMESVVQQVESLRSNVDGLESSLGITRVELEAAVTRMKRAEVETRKVEEALQRLQNDLLSDLSEGIKEVKEAREKDFSSLETTVEERLAEVSRSISASVAEFAASQGEAQRQLADLKSRLGVVEDPALIKQELSAIVDAVAEIKTTKQETDRTANSLREQIGAVREELQTRNQEVASLSQEVQTVRSLVQETTGTLKQSLSAAQAEVQTLKDQSEMFQSSLEQVSDALRAVEEKANAAAAQAQRKSEDLAASVKASSESEGSLSASLSDVGSKVESLFARYDAHESSFAAQLDAVKRVKTDLKQELEAVKTTVEELLSNNADGASKDNQRVEEMERRLAALRPEELDELKVTVDELKNRAAKLEVHDQDISALKEALQGTALVGEEQEGARSSLEELRSNIAAFSETQSELTEKHSNWDQLVEELERRLTALEDRV